MYLSDEKILDFQSRFALAASPNLKDFLNIII